MYYDFGAFQVLRFKRRPGTPGNQNDLEFPNFPGQLLSEMAPAGVSMNLEMTKQPVFPSEPYDGGKA